MTKIHLALAAVFAAVAAVVAWLCGLVGPNTAGVVAARLRQNRAAARDVELMIERAAGLRNQRQRTDLEAKIAMDKIEKGRAQLVELDEQAVALAAHYRLLTQDTDEIFANDFNSRHSRH